MEVHLDRRLAQRRVYSAIDIEPSGTRHEELLLNEADFGNRLAVRRMAAMIVPPILSNFVEATERILERRKSPDECQFLANLQKDVD